MAARPRVTLETLLQLWELTPTEWADLGQALLLLPAAGLGLKLLGFKRTQTLMAPRTAAEHNEEALTRARSMARMVSAAAQYGPYRATCLKKALVLRWMLARVGIAAELKIGVRKAASEAVEAHAWVEAAGEVLLEGPDVEERFAAFDSLPSERADGSEP